MASRPKCWPSHCCLRKICCVRDDPAGNRNCPGVSSEVYGHNDEDIHAQTRPGGHTRVGTRWNIRSAKLRRGLGFSFARKFDIPTVVARFFNTVGPRQSSRYACKFHALSNRLCMARHHRVRQWDRHYRSAMVRDTVQHLITGVACNTRAWFAMSAMSGKSMRMIWRPCSLNVAGSRPRGIKHIVSAGLRRRLRRYPPPPALAG